MLELNLTQGSSSLYQNRTALASQSGSSPTTAPTLVGSDLSTEGQAVKNIVLFLDGTSNEFSSNPHTNVLRLFQLTLKDKPGQVCYYQPGIGTRFEEESEDNWYTNMLDEAFATSLSRHVVAAYNYIVSQYEPGDKIYLFGFSRGSFTCRVLAGMIERVGLIYRGLEHLTHQAWEYYSNWVKSLEQAQSDDQRALYEVFRETFCRSNVDIYFMGIFDSVNSVGLLRDKVFPYVVRSSNVTHVRHAISLDERRAKFKDLFIKDNEALIEEALIEEARNQEARNQEARNQEARNQESEVQPNTSFKELVFSGNHGDIGGGWHPDTRVSGTDQPTDTRVSSTDQPTDSRVSSTDQPTDSRVSGTDQPTDTSDPWDKEWRYLSGVLMRWLLREAIESGVLFQPLDIERFNSVLAIQYSIFGYWHDILSFRRSPQVKPKLNLRPYRSWNSIVVSPRARISEIPRLYKLESEPPALNRFDGHGYGAYFKTLLWWLLEYFPFTAKVDMLNNDSDPNSSQNATGQSGPNVRTRLTLNLGRHRNIGYTADYHWSVFYRIHFVSDYNPRNISYKKNKEKWNLGTKFLNLMKPKEQSFTRSGLWGEIEAFATKLGNLEDNDDYNRTIKDDRSEFWSYIPDDLLA